MTRSLEAIGVLVITLAVVGALMNLFGLSRSSTASGANSSAALTVTISPEELTRSAGPMPVQEIESFH